MSHGSAHHIIHSLILSLESRAWQEPEPSHVTSMALAHCIRGKFLGVVCHCFPPPLDVPTLAARCLRPQRRERSQQRKVELWARKTSGSNFHLSLGIFYIPQIYDMGPTALLPLRRKACWGFFRPKNPASAGFEPAILGTKDQHATPRPPKPIYSNKYLLCWRGLINLLFI